MSGFTTIKCKDESCVHNVDGDCQCAEIELEPDSTVGACKTYEEPISEGDSLKAYNVEFDGSYLGGHTTVLANSEEKALQLLRDHYDQWGTKAIAKKYLRNLRVTEEFKLDEAKIVWHWDGEY